MIKQDDDKWYKYEANPSGINNMLENIKMTLEGLKREVQLKKKQLERMDGSNRK